MKKWQFFLVGLVMVGCCNGTFSEMRMWTFKTGETLEAEYVKDLFEKIVLRDANGKEWTILKDKFVFSAEDLEYLDLENPPELVLEFRKSITQKNFTMVRFAEDRPSEQRATFGALVKQKGYQEYNYPMTVEFFAIGKEIKGNRYILLDRLSQPFRLTKENKKEFEFYSERIVHMTDTWGDSENYSRRGEQYAGFLIVVKDKRGKVIAMDGSDKWLEQNLATLEERYIGNYMDETCQRTYPTRPKSYIASTASDRE